MGRDPFGLCDGKTADLSDLWNAIKIGYGAAKKVYSGAKTVYGVYQIGVEAKEKG